MEFVIDQFSIFMVLVLFLVIEGIIVNLVMPRKEEQS